jgi:two-component system chemotaxis response regulator CheB
MLRLEGTAVKSPFAIAPATGLGAFALVGIGCSAGCVPILKELASYFDKRWRAAFVVTTHIGAHESYLPELLQKDCSLHVAHAEDFDLLEPHRVYIAPPDRHLIVRRAHLRLDNGPRQNWTRPAIDPMLCSGADHYGPVMTGVLLTGHLSDGAAGLHRVRHRGGMTIVQDPAEAPASDMPANAMRKIDPDYVVAVKDMRDALEHCIATNLAARMEAAHD